MKYCVTFKTERGQFRFWHHYADTAKQIAAELFKMGALGVEVYNTKTEKVVFKRGEITDPT